MMALQFSSIALSLRKSIVAVLCCLCFSNAYSDRVLNIYTWGSEIPRALIQQFEKDTGIKVNLSNYDGNETMFAKLKASSQPIYDVISPSSYYVTRMQKLDMLTPLDKTKLPNLKNLLPQFTNNTYDPHNAYSIPLVAGMTGIFYNQAKIKHPPDDWNGLWHSKWAGKVMLIDDPREVFSIALISLGYSPNDTDPEHIKQAYKHLLQLIPNIRLFAADGIKTLMIDEDVILGSSWSGDAGRAHQENPDISFLYPRSGFVIWVDTMAIPKGAPHPEEAYAFINYMLRPESAVAVALKEGHAITNAEGIKLLPPEVRNNPVIYPPKEVLARGIFQTDVGEATLNLYSDYWQRFKLAF